MRSGNEGDRSPAAGSVEELATWQRLTDRDEAVREEALDELERSPRADTVPLLEDFLLRESDMALKLRAVELLEEREPGRSVPALGRGLNDPDPEVRMASAEALETIGGREAILTLWLTVGQERDPDVRDTVLDALDSLGEDVERYRE